MFALTNGDDNGDFTTSGIQLVWGEQDDGYDPDTGPFDDLEAGYCFDPSRDIMYMAYSTTGDGDGEGGNNGGTTGSYLVAFQANPVSNSTYTWNVLYQVPIGESLLVTTPQDFSTDMMAISSDGAVVFVGTPTEIRLFYTRDFLVYGFPSPTTTARAGNFTVTAVNINGTINTSYQGTVEFTSSDSQSQLPADYTFAAADNGTHNFSAVLITVGMQSITVTDTADNTITGSQTGIVVVPDVPDHLAFSVQPSDSLAGSAISPAVQVEEFDKFGNLETYDDTSQVTLTITSGSGPFESDSTTTVTLIGGVATFSNLIFDTPGTYTLGESASSGVTGPDSTSFKIRPAAPDHLAFTVQPSDSIAGVAISPPVVVEEFDRYNNLETGDNSHQVTLTVASGPGSFTSDSITTAIFSGGIATFGDLAFLTAGTYILADSATSGLSGPHSVPFIIHPAAPDHLAFIVQPSDTVAGQAIAPAVIVSEFDKYGNLETGDSSNQVTVSVASGPGGVTSGSTATVTLSGGIATFSNLVFDTAGNYTLAESTASGVTGPHSVAFTILPAALDHLIWTVQPSRTTAGVAISPAVQIEEFDKFGNLETTDSSNQMTVNVASGPGAFASGSTTTLTVSGGIGTFSNQVLDTAGIYDLGVQSGGLTGPDSNSFMVDPAAPDHLVFSVQPSNTTAGVAISPAVQVQVFDRYGNLLTEDNTDKVTLSVASGPGNFYSSSSTTSTVSGGIATFGPLVFLTAGTYTLADRLTGGVTGPNSNSFTVNPGVARPSRFQRAAEQHNGRSTLLSSGTGSRFRSVWKSRHGRQQRSGVLERCQWTGGLRQRQHAGGKRERRRRHVHQCLSRHRRHLHPWGERDGRTDRPRFRRIPG